MTPRCTDYRRSMLADPHSEDPELRAHRAGCAECAGFADRLAIFEARIGRAMRLTQDEPAAAEHGLAGRRRGPAVRWLALAASLCVAVGAAAILWLAVPRSSLARDVVAHMAEEPQAWRSTDVAVTADELAAVLHDAHMRLEPQAGLVSYANSCAFRGHEVPHLVVQDGRNPVTVMILVHENAARPVNFDEGGYRGVIVPMPRHGALAVLTRGANADPAEAQRVAARVQGAIVWTG
jgi:hypothetical protein